MTRLEELTLKCADNSMTAAEASELEALLNALPANSGDYLRLLELEAVLRGRRTELDLTGPTMDRLQRGITESIAREVVETIRSEPAPKWHPSRKIVTGRFSGGSSWRLWLALAASLVLLLAPMLWFAVLRGSGALLATVAGEGVFVERGAERWRAAAGVLLKDGDVLRTSSNGIALVQFRRESTRIQVQPATELQFIRMSGSKQMGLHLGQVQASVAHQRHGRSLSVSTAQANATVLGTKFVVDASSENTRLEVTEGQVRFKRRADGAEVIVRPGFCAVAGPGQDLTPRALPGSGGVLAEYWTNVPGTYHVGYLALDPRYPDHPSWHTYLGSFAASSKGENFGARFRAYVHPPVTGKYTFWLAAWEGAELYLSPDDRPEHKVQIAYANSTDPEQWDKHAGQGSSALTLRAGGRYYIEAVQKQSTGPDHLAVAWQGPNRPRELIPGEYLSPFEPNASSKEEKR